MKTCYNCLSSNNNCSWSKNLCSSQSPLNFSNNNKPTKNSFLSQSYIDSQYKCIKNKNDIEIFKQYRNDNITLSLPPKNFQNLEKINYHIYCFEYSSISNILLTIEYIEKYKNNILHLSLYDNTTNSDKNLKKDLNENKIKIKIKIITDFFCIKATYILEDIEESISIITINIEQYVEHNKKNENIMSYFILGAIILFISIIIWAFIIWHRNNSGIMKEITILNKANIYQEQHNETNGSENQNQDNNRNNCDNSNCSELQEKYFKLEQKSFVAHNYDTLDSFVNNIHDIKKKNIYLKTIIKTMPCFVIGINNRDLIGSLCHFCENNIKLNDKVCLLNCGHIFHYDCIDQQIITYEEYKCIICKESIII